MFCFRSVARVGNEIADRVLLKVEDAMHNTRLSLKTLVEDPSRKITPPEVRTIKLPNGLTVEEAIRYTLHSMRHRTPTCSRPLNQEDGRTTEIGHWAEVPRHG